MAVLAIIGVLLTLATVNLSFDRAGGELRHEAERLAALLLLARDESIIRARPLGLRLVSDGYTFLVHESGGWQVLERDDVLRERRLSERLVMSLDGGWVDPAPAGRGMGRGERQGRGDGPLPQVVFTPTGEATPFTIRLESDAVAGALRVAGDGLGRITVEEPDDT